MTPQQILPRLKHVDHTNADLGSGTVIVPDRHGAVVRLILTADTSYTVPDPSRSGPEFFINHVSGAFTATITFATAYTESGATVYKTSSPGQFAAFKAFETASGTFVWRQIGGDPSAITAAITAVRTLTAADSGGVFSVAKTSAYAITLPTPAQGLRFKFMVLDTGANAVTIASGGAWLKGVVSVNNTNVAMTGTTLSLASGGSVGDYVAFEGIDATNYLVTGACIAAADITIA